MAARDLIIDPAAYDLEKVIADIDEIRRYNPQRFEVEQLTAIVYSDDEKNICVGYKDVGPDEFWVRGHMPGMPLMPGVIMCEAAAQLCSYHVQRHDLMGVEVLGFGGLDDVKFRGVVRPGDRLVVSAALLKVRRGALIRCRFQALVGEMVVCEGKLQGIPIPTDLLRQPR